MTPVVDRRWSAYVLASNTDFANLVAEHFSANSRRVGFLMGRGFDPRMNLGLRALLNSSSEQSVTVITLEFAEGPNSPSNRYSHLVEDNQEDFTSLTNGRAQVESMEVTIWSPDGRRIGS